MKVEKYLNARNKFMSDYLEAGKSLKKMPKEYALIKFITNDGDMLFSASKRIEIIGLMNTFFGNKTWIVINHQNDKKFHDKIDEIVKLYEGRGCKVSVTLVSGLR
jgi:hypothetical protein